VSADVLTPNELAALASMLVPGTMTEAAARAGIDERTLRRYLAQPTFRTALREAQGAAVMAASSALADASSAAVELLKRMLTDAEAPHTAQVAAARTILQFATQSIVDAEMAAQLEALKAADAKGRS
jgi:hypothetical protein